MQNNNKGTIVFTTKFSYFIIVLPLKVVHYNKIQQQQHESEMISEIYTTAATTFKQWFEFLSNSRIRILAIWIQIFFVFRSWRRLQHITELSSWIIYSLQLLLQGTSMFTKILYGQMPKWDKKLHSRWKQEKPHWKSIHMRVSLKLKIVSLAVSRP